MSKITDTSKIKLTGKENPHRKGSKDFAKYAKLAAVPAASRTVAKVAEAGVGRGYLRYAVEREIVSFS